VVRHGNNEEWLALILKAALHDMILRLPYAADAPFNSYTRQHEQGCLPNTRVDVLEKIFKWAEEQNEEHFFWLKGWAGAGKTTIARTVSRRYHDRNRLGASFFFSRNSGDVSHAGKFVTSIAVQLANNIPFLQPYVCEAIAGRTNIAHQALNDQWYQLVLLPLSRSDVALHLRSPFIIVVDALDECESENDIKMICQLFAEVQRLIPHQLRIFMTSRPETSIRSGVYHIPHAMCRDLVLHDVSPAIVDQDISVFIRYSLAHVAKENFLHPGWPREQDIRHLVECSSGLFIWAATACRFISEGKRFASNRLSAVIRSGSSFTSPGKYLDGVYLTVLTHSISPSHSEEERSISYSMLRYVLGSIVILFYPLPARTLSKLLQLPMQYMSETLADLHSILYLPEDEDCVVRLHHPSFSDFLLDATRCSNTNILVDERQAHRVLAINCIRILSISLKEDICGFGSPGILLAEVDGSQIRQSLPQDVQYACVSWVTHVRKSGVHIFDDDLFHLFLKEHLLHWLEALSWMHRMSEGVLAISCLHTIASVSL
jgi:hypothetical protein